MPDPFYLLERAEAGEDVEDKIEEIVQSAYDQAQTAIDYAVALWGDSDDIEKAVKEMVKAEEEELEGHPHHAVKHFAKALEYAQKALQ